MNNRKIQETPTGGDMPLLKGVKKEAQVCDDTLIVLGNLLNSTPLSRKSAAESNIVNNITGKSQTLEIKRLATDEFQYYTQLVDQYTNAKSDIISLSSNYVILRGHIVDIHRKYSNVLIDIFGDSIKVVAPNLFDFDKIEWLDVGSMCKNIELDYFALDKSCTTLLGEISEGVRNSINKSLEVARTSRSKSNAAIGIGLILLDRYLETTDQIATLEQEYVLFKGKMSADKAKIVADSGRLNIIFKTINDLYIPQANGFFRYGDEVLSVELKKLIEAIYSTKALKQLASKRDSIFEKIKTESNSIDHYNIEIEVCSTEIKNGNKSIADNRPAYNKAISNKPAKPSAFLNILSFGYLQGNYQRKYYSWYEMFGNSIIEYQKLIKEVKAAQKKLEVDQTELNSALERCHQAELELKQINQDIRSAIKIDKDVQLAILPHLKSMISLLHSARAIAESKLDNNIIKRVDIKIDNSNANTLTQIISDGIDQFSESMRSAMALEREELEAIKQQSPVSSDNGQCTDLECENEMSDENIAMSYDVSIKAVNVFANLAKLEVLRQQEKYDNMLYMEELARLQKEFQHCFEDIDDKSALLKDILKQVKTSNNVSEIKDGLISLGLITEKEFTEQDMEAFMNGELDINL